MQSAPSGNTGRRQKLGQRSRNESTVDLISVRGTGAVKFQLLFGLAHFTRNSSATADVFRA